MGVTDLFAVLKYRKLIVLWSVIVGIAVGAALSITLPTKYFSSAKVQVDSLQRNSLTGYIEPRVRVGEYLGQQVAIASSRTVALDVIRRLSDEGLVVLADFEHRWREETKGEIVAGNDLRLWVADEMLRDLEIKANEIESTIELGFRADDPAQAARIANAFASSYMATVLDQKQRKSARRAASFSDETEDLVKNVTNAQNDLAEFREQSGVIPLGQHKIEAAEIQLSTLTERLGQARADLAEAVSLKRQAETRPISEMISFPLPFEATSARESQARLVAVAPIVARLAERYGPKYPDYVEAANEKATLERDILRSIRERAQVAESRVAALEAQVKGLKADVVEMQKTRQTYDLLEDKVQASQDTYNLVTTRTLEESLQSRIDSIDVFLLARATPPSRPATPPFWAILMLGALVGIALGASIAVFAELLEGRVRNSEVVARSLRTQTVCEIGDGSGARRRRKFQLRLAS
jgi:uncharacterized protein involved in exopolysaccharide biosynthesis